MKIILAGGTGQVGRMLLRAWTHAGHDCVVLTRHPSPTLAARSVAWNGCTLGPWVTELDGADLVVNLAGRSVNCRYTEKNLGWMMRSRVESTRVLGQAIAFVGNPPKLWLQAGTSTIYAHRHDAPNDEATGLIGGAEPGVPALWKRSIDIALAWEAELDAAPTPRTRKVSLRSAMIMSPDRGGVFSAFATLCSLGMGPQGDGTQYVSWIHEQDFIAALDFIIRHEHLAGAINLCAPHPLTNRAFVAALHTALGRRLSVRAPSWVLETGALIIRTETELLLKSRRVIPGRLLDAGFRFQFPEWPSSAADLVRRWRR